MLGNSSQCCTGSTLAPSCGWGLLKGTPAQEGSGGCVRLCGIRTCMDVGQWHGWGLVCLKGILGPTSSLHPDRSAMCEAGLQHEGHSP